MGQEEEGARATTNNRPLDVPDMLEIRGAERERTAIEKDGVTSHILLPQPAAIGASLARSQQVAMLIDMAKLKQAVVRDNKLLIHE